jgi:hypothetical protein
VGKDVKERKARVWELRNLGGDSNCMGKAPKKRFFSGAVNARRS